MKVEFGPKTRGALIMKIGVVGLGYVGLPLAALFASKYEVIGFDINMKRVEELEGFYDRTCEVASEDLQTKNLSFTANFQAIKECDVVIVTVPTPITEARNPDLKPIESATKSIAPYLKRNAIVVYESTVYPGVTEEICVPLLEEYSGLKWKQDFFVGYSPERVNPGDKNHTIDKIVKVVSGDTETTVQSLERLYGSIITAGIFVASSIKVAEAAKVIENTQRDVNIALMNELFTYIVDPRARQS